MKTFSIRKAANPAQLRGTAAGADMIDDSMKYGYETGNSKTNPAQPGNKDHQPSLLTQEEQE